jgi:ATP-binding cassette subfamily C protein
VICLGFFFIDPITTLAAVAYFGIIAVVIQHFIGERMSAAGKITTESAVEANSAISDLLSVFRELLVIGKREKYIQAIYDARLATANSSATQYYLTGMPRYIIEAALLVGLGLFGLSQALSGDLVGSAATIGVFLSGGFRLSAAMLPLQSALLSIKATIPAAQTAHGILMLDSTNDKREGSVLKVPRRSRPSEFTNPIGVNLNGVSFFYPDSSVAALNSVSFSIQPGSQVALMGPSGAGKSTIADILCSVLSPTEGEVTFTSMKRNSGEVEVVGGVSYVPQRPGIVSGTILDNVALAEDIEKVDRTEALKALRLAHLDDLVASLPKGLDTMLGKLQDGLSGGQLQRLGIARALYTKPSLLVMDEATSALDAESEAKIQKTLAFLRGKVTVVLIAHRLNTIQHADQVVLVEEGRVKDSGTFKELIARNPSVEKVVNLMQIHRD